MERKLTEDVVITNVDETQGIVEAIWAVMGNVDDGNDIIHSGAFTKTFHERGNQIKLLDNHRTDSVLNALGTISNLREVPATELPAEIRERHPDATGGASGQFRFLLDTPEGKGAFTRIQKGAVKGWSFGYDAVDKDHSTITKDGKDIAVRNLRSIKLYEISPVLFPMNEATATVSAKNKLGEDEDKAKWSASFINNLPDSSFLHIEAGGEKDGEGKTTPRSLRHLPYRDGEGNVDLPHLRNALSRLGQPMTGEAGGEKWLTEALRKRLTARARRILEREQGKADGEPEQQKSDDEALSITEVVDLLIKALKDAGLMDTEHKTTGPSEPDPTPTSDEEAGPPNEDEDTHLMDLINIELEEMEV